MTKTSVFLLAFALGFTLAARAEGQVAGGPDTVVVQSGALKLRALLWRPRGRGPFPAVLFNHGSGHGVRAPSGDYDEHTMEWQAAALGPVFARHGYVFLYLLRRGTGLSADQGVNSSDLWDRELAAHGEEARNRLQFKLLETVELDDALAGLTFLRALPEVDARRVAVVGHSFGGSLTLLVAERDSALRAAVVFSSSARSWPRSPQLRRRLISAVARTVVPVFFIFAANDYSVAPGEMLAAEMKRLGKPHQFKIYPAVGRTAGEGHGFVHLRVTTWEPDVFVFLDKHLTMAGARDKRRTLHN
jgi:carboxymethylenebutenolidase